MKLSGYALVLALMTFCGFAHAMTKWDTLNQELESLYEQGDFKGATVVARQALQTAEQTLDPHHPDIATSLNSLALLYNAQGKYTLAEPLLKRALAIFEKSSGPESAEVAATLNNLAMLYGRQGDDAQAESLYQRALAIDEKTLGTDHPDVAMSLNNLAQLYQAQEQYTKAEPLLERAAGNIGENARPEPSECGDESEQSGATVQCSKKIRTR